MKFNLHDIEGDVKKWINNKNDITKIETNINITSGGAFGTNNKTTPTVYFLVTRLPV